MKYAFSILTVFLASFSAALAKFPEPDKDNQIKNTILDKGPQSVLDFIDVISDWFFAILIAVSVIYILIAAYTYLSSKGGEGVESAHKMLMFAAVGIVVAVLAKGIVFTIRKVVDSSTPLKTTSSLHIYPYDTTS